MPLSSDDDRASGDLLPAIDRRSVPHEIARANRRTEPQSSLGVDGVISMPVRVNNPASSDDERSPTSMARLPTGQIATPAPVRLVMRSPSPSVQGRLAKTPSPSRLWPGKPPAAVVVSPTPLRQLPHAQQAQPPSKSHRTLGTNPVDDKGDDVRKGAGNISKLEKLLTSCDERNDNYLALSVVRLENKLARASQEIRVLRKKCQHADIARKCAEADAAAATQRATIAASEVHSHEVEKLRMALYNSVTQVQLLTDVLKELGESWIGRSARSILADVPGLDPDAVLESVTLPIPQWQRSPAVVKSPTRSPTKSPSRPLAKSKSGVIFSVDRPSETRESGDRLVTTAPLERAAVTASAGFASAVLPPGHVSSATATPLGFPSTRSPLELSSTVASDGISGAKTVDFGETLTATSALSGRNSSDRNTRGGNLSSSESDEDDGPRLASSRPKQRRATVSVSTPSSPRLSKLDQDPEAEDLKGMDLAGSRRLMIRNFSKHSLQSASGSSETGRSPRLNDTAFFSHVSSYGPAGRMLGMYMRWLKTYASGVLNRSVEELERLLSYAERQRVKQAQVFSKMRAIHGQLGAELAIVRRASAAPQQPVRLTRRDSPSTPRPESQDSETSYNIDEMSAMLLEMERTLEERHLAVANELLGDVRQMSQLHMERTATFEIGVQLCPADLTMFVARSAQTVDFERASVAALAARPTRKSMANVAPATMKDRPTQTDPEDNIPQQSMRRLLEIRPRVTSEAQTNLSLPSVDRPLEHVGQYERDWLWGEHVHGARRRRHSEADVLRKKSFDGETQTDLTAQDMGEMVRVRHQTKPHHDEDALDFLMEHNKCTRCHHLQIQVKNLEYDLEKMRGTYLSNRGAVQDLRQEVIRVRQALKTREGELASACAKVQKLEAQCSGEAEAGRSEAARLQQQLAVDEAVKKIVAVKNKEMEAAKQSSFELGVMGGRQKGYDEGYRAAKEDFDFQLEAERAQWAEDNPPVVVEKVIEKVVHIEVPLDRSSTGRTPVSEAPDSPLLVVEPARGAGSSATSTPAASPSASSLHRDLLGSPSPSPSPS
eukprot:Rmarinus@m.24148